MKTFRVYLNLSKNKLIISANNIDYKNFHELFNTSGINDYELIKSCKIFCMGYMQGSNFGERNVNNRISDFKI